MGVQQATTGAKYAQEKGIDAQQFEDSGLLVQALQAGTIDAALGNQSVLGYAIKDNSDSSAWRTTPRARSWASP